MVGSKLHQDSHISRNKYTIGCDESMRILEGDYAVERTSGFDGDSDIKRVADVILKLSRK